MCVTVKNHCENNLAKNSDEICDTNIAEYQLVHFLNIITKVFVVLNISIVLFARKSAN